MNRWLISILVVLLSLPAFAQPWQHIEVGLVGAKSMTSWHGQSDLQALNFAFVHPISPRTDVSVVFAPVSLWQPRSWFGNQYHDGNENVRAVLATLMLRRTFNRDSERVHYYLEGGSGPMVAEKRVPASTSHFNFMSQAGLGVVLRPNGRFPVLLGCRFQHISNGGYSPRNPGINFPSLLVGVRFKTARTPRG